MKKIVALLFTAGLLISCGNTKTPAPEKKKIKTIVAESVQVSSERSYSFIAQPYRTSELSFRIGGPIVNLDVQSGQYFRKGHVIAEIDNRDFKVRNERAKAVFDRAEADYIRISNLLQKKSVSEASYEKAKADYEQAKANYTETQNNLKDTRLTAPFNGYVQAVHTERFQDIKPSVPVITFIDLSRIKVETYVPEEIAMQFRNKTNGKYEISFNAVPDKTFTPTEIYLSQSTASNNISYCLTAVINNADGKLFGGMAGKMSLNSDENKTSCSVITVPQTVVCNDPVNGCFVWKIENNKVVRCAVETGRLKKDNKIEILEGLKAGDVIATNRLQALSEGEEISVND